MTHTCDGRVAIVTGASGEGIGRSIALTLAREGASVVVNYRSNHDRAAAVVDAIEGRGGKAYAVAADIFEPTGCQALVDVTLSQFGQVDICVVDPGGGWHDEPIEALDAAGALEDLHHEVAPLYYLMPRVLPGMIERHWGRLIGIGLHPTKLPPAYAYNVAKAARAEALRLAQDQAWPHGVTVNTIGPGPVGPIGSLEEAIALCDHAELWRDRTNVSPQDIAEGVAFLCSEAANYVTGCTLPYLFAW